MRECIQCGLSKDFSEFYKDRTQKDGYRTTCRSCVCQFFKNKRDNDPIYSQKIRDRNRNRQRISKGISTELPIRKSLQAIDPVLNKVCGSCKTEKAKSEFYKDRTKEDGINFYCKLCSHNKLKNRRKSDPVFSERQRTNSRKRHRRRSGLDENLPRMTGERGNGFVTGNGYKVFKMTGHPLADKSGRVLGHHLAYYTHTKTQRKPGETIHHINGIRDDNRIENLELWSTKHPSGQRVEDKIKWCIDFLSEYGYTSIKM